MLYILTEKEGKLVHAQQYWANHWQWATVFCRTGFEPVQLPLSKALVVLESLKGGILIAHSDIEQLNPQTLEDAKAYQIASYDAQFDAVIFTSSWLGAWSQKMPIEPGNYWVCEPDQETQLMRVFANNQGHLLYILDDLIQPRQWLRRKLVQKPAKVPAAQFETMQRVVDDLN